jgi:hypothetical protein
MNETAPLIRCAIYTRKSAVLQIGADDLLA